MPKRTRDEEFERAAAARAGRVWVRGANDWTVHHQADDRPNTRRGGARVGPHPLLGEEGAIFDETTNDLYDTKEDYLRAIELYRRATDMASGRTMKLRPRNNDRILTSRLSAEAEILGLHPAGGIIMFKPDVTGTYLLWSMPLHTGRNVQGQVPGSTLEQVSGEAASEREVEAFLGFMMKQTREHFEALTAMRIVQGEAGVTARDIVSQYGKVNRRAFRVDRIDPLHHPRDTVAQDDFISVLIAIEKCLENYRTDPRAAITLRRVLNEHNVGRYYARIRDLIKNLDPQLTDVERARDFGRLFAGSGMNQQIFAEIDRHAGKTSPIDKDQEVSRVDKKEGNLRLVGYHRQQFDSVWAAKSSAVMEKAARLAYAIRSSGLRYHPYPRGTVQAKDEYPTYIKTLRQMLARTTNGVLRGFYEKMIVSAEDSLATIMALPPKGNLSYPAIAALRAQAIDRLDQNNVTLTTTASAARKRMRTS